MSARGEKALVSTVLLAVTVPVFFAAGALPSTHVPASWLATRWDTLIPLVPEAVWPYLSWYLAPWLLLAAPQRDFRRVVGAIALAFATCMLVYVLIPASLERPLVAGVTRSERVLLLLYQYDPPWNIFPSFHAALCALLWKPAFGGALARRIMPVWMSAICVACVLTKQHHLLDVVAGALLGFVALAAATAVFNRLDRGEGETPAESTSWGPTPVGKAS